MISLSRYAALLADADLRQAYAVSLLGRAPIGIAGLALVLLVRSTTGSYSQAGVVTAAYVLGLGAVSPVWGRLIDRTGPRRVLRRCALLYPLALFALVLAAYAGAATLAALCSGLAGACFPPVTVCMRALLRRRFADDARLATAFSLDATLIELVFIGGPLLVALLVAAWSPAAAVAAAALSGCVGAWLFQRTSALAGWHPSVVARPGFAGPLANRGFPTLLMAVLAYSTAFGLVEIGVAAYAAERGHPALAGVLLGIMSIGSVVGGLAYGSRNWHLPLAQQFAVSLTGMGIGVLPLAIASSQLAFGLLSVLAGVAMAPALIIQSIQVTKLVRPEYSTEGFTWSATALLSGVGIGFAAGGILIELAGAASAFAAAAVTALGAAGFARIGLATRD